LIWLAAAGFVICAYLVRGALIPFIIAFLIAYALDPFLSRMEAKKIPRTAGIVILLLATLLVGAVGGVLAYPAMEREVLSFAGRAPQYAGELARNLRPLLEKAAELTGYDVDTALRAMVEKLGFLPLEMRRWAYGVAASTLSSIPALAGTLLGFLIIPVAAFYFMRDYAILKEKAFALAPPRHRPKMREIYSDINAILAAYVRGQLIVVSTLAALFTAGLWLIGMPMWIFIGLLSGLANIVPYLPLVAGLLPSLIITWLHFGDGFHLLLVLALYGGVQAFEGLYLTPKVMGGAVGLHPVAIMVSIFIGGLLMGIIGIIAAVPAAAVIKVLLDHALRAYRSSGFFQD
jgi:predicted PurR-regulated permease PerM